MRRPTDEGLPPSYALLRTFAFGVLPTIVFFSSLMSILYHLGVMQRLVELIARIMQRTLLTSGAESLSAAANIFVGQTEAPLVIRPYISSMTRSELNAIMVGGFATVAGGVMAAYVQMGIDAGHLLTASVISAPAALLIAKLMVPESETPMTLGHVRVQVERKSVNVIEAAAAGASDGLKLALNVGAMLLVFLACFRCSMESWDGVESNGTRSLNGSRVGSPGHPGVSRPCSVGCLHPSAGSWESRGRTVPRRVSCRASGWSAMSSSPTTGSGSGWRERTNRHVQRTVLIMTYALSGFANFSSNRNSARWHRRHRTRASIGARPAGGESDVGWDVGHADDGVRCRRARCRVTP